jgi:hypothetical protein
LDGKGFFRVLQGTMKEEAKVDVRLGRKPPPLRLIRGGLHCQMIYGALRIVAGPETTPPFPVAAMACEEDTWLVLSADPKVCTPEVHPIRIMTDLIEARPEPVGTVLVRGNRPVRLLAVVHDLDQDPTWKEEWISAALAEVFRTVEREKIGSLGLPLLGTRHGRLGAERFAQLLGAELEATDPVHLNRLWLITSGGTNRIVMNTLRTAINPC